jgi:predicted site-specific integrase-resolvase
LRSLAPMMTGAAVAVDRIPKSMDIGYARVSTATQDLDRQIDALRGEGIPAKHFYVDKKSGSATNRPDCMKPLTRPARETSSWCTPRTGWDAPSGIP